MTESEARQNFPELLSIVECKVLPARLKLRDNDHGKRLRANWWKFNWPRPELYEALQGMRRALVCSQVSAHHQFALLSTDILFANYVIVFVLDSYAAFAALQARPHEIWAQFFGSSMKDDLRYTPSDCFETFAFPREFERNSVLERAGRDYYEFRAALMVKNNEGLTKTYNRFHDPDERSPDILKLRELHTAMDRAVLDAYGWNDIPTGCEFLLDYEEESDDDEGSRKRKKPWRYRWPDEVRDEVLARLLALNAQRAEEERLAGAAAAEQRSTSKQRRGRKPKGTAGASLFDDL